MQCDTGFSPDTFYINKYNFCYPFLPLLGVLSGNPKNASMGHSVFGNPKVGMTLVLALLFFT